MYKIKAIKGNINLSVFDLEALTSKANQTSAEIKAHNIEVGKKFLELVTDYTNQINVIMGELRLPRFNNLQNAQRDDWFMSPCHGGGARASFDFGHGRARITIKFSSECIGEKLSYDFKGELEVYKNWLGHGNSSYEKYKLESVAQIFELGADVIKLHIIDRDVKNHTQKTELEQQLTY